MLVNKCCSSVLFLVLVLTYNVSVILSIRNIDSPTKVFMDTIHSVADNDDYMCIPKLLCAWSSTAKTNLPVTVNSESFLQSLTSLPTVSPVLTFAKAAIIGFNSKGNKRFCVQAYPRCPEDSNKLMYYLNNHNGGFFRYFDNNRIQKRILHKPNFQINSEITFPNSREIENGLNLVFPTDEDLDFQKPLPGHKKQVEIFPVRTGTGELKLDPHELQDDPYNGQLYFRDGYRKLKTLSNKYNRFFPGDDF